eukprot:4426661-Prymnesium_polylepis.1
MPVALTGHGGRRRQPRDGTRRRPSWLPAFPRTRAEGANLARTKIGLVWNSLATGDRRNDCFSAQPRRTSADRCNRFCANNITKRALKVKAQERLGSPRSKNDRAGS